MPNSWWLKVKRAQKHMVDIRTEARRYAERQPYKFVRLREPDGRQQVRYRLRITDQPNPMLALMVGDFVHNLRSALDHVIFACVPKKKRSNSTHFPISYVDIFAKDANGGFVVKDNEARAGFERAIDGLHPHARAIVIVAQPYHLGSDAQHRVFGIVSRLDNADKHRALAAIGVGVKDLTANVTAKGQTIRLKHGLKRHAFVEDGTIVGWDLPDYVTPSEVDMEYSATAVIHIKATGVQGNEPLSSYPLYLTMLEAISDVRAMLRIVERFKVA